jgi:uncharacterized membrane protein
MGMFKTRTTNLPPRVCQKGRAHDVASRGTGSAGAEASDQPTHVQQTIQAIAALHAEHYDSATAGHRLAERLTNRISHPIFVLVVTVLVIGWVGFNACADRFGFAPVDPPPFAWLESACSLTSLYLVVFVLVTQRREEQFAGRQALVALEMALLTEQKVAKIIELLEELRRDSPVPDRPDALADAMAVPANPRSVLNAIDKGGLGHEPIA